MSIRGAFKLMAIGLACGLAPALACCGEDRTGTSEKATDEAAKPAASPTAPR